MHSRLAIAGILAASGLLGCAGTPDLSNVLTPAGGGALGSAAEMVVDRSQAYVVVDCLLSATGSLSNCRAVESNVNEIHEAATVALANKEFAFDPSMPGFVAGARVRQVIVMPEDSRRRGR